MADRLPQSKHGGTAADGSQSPFDLKWYAYVDEKTFGPYTGHQIRAMVEKSEIVESDLVALDGSSSWVQAKDDPVLRLLFVRADLKASRSSERHTAKRGRRINLIAGVVILACLVWLAWPYYAVYDLAAGLRRGDEATLEGRVNWESVRQSLRGDLNASLLKKASADQSELGRNLSLVLGPTFVNQMVDGYVTPQAIVRLVKGQQPKDTNNSESLPSGAEIQEAFRRFSAKQIAFAFFSGNPFTFRIDLRPADTVQTSGVATLIFKWSGDWSLTRVTLPLDEIEKSEQVKAQPAPAITSSPKPSLAAAPVVVAPAQSKPSGITWGRMFQSQVERCWKKPYGGTESQNAEAAFEIKLKRDGTLESSPVPKGTPSTPYLRVYQESAMRAIIECQPYNLPAAYFDEWKYFSPVFTERLASR